MGWLTHYTRACVCQCGRLVIGVSAVTRMVVTNTLIRKVITMQPVQRRVPATRRSIVADLPPTLSSTSTVRPSGSLQS